MQEVLRLESTDWELTVWCPDITKRQKALDNTLLRRGKSLGSLTTTLKFHEPIQIRQLQVCGDTIDVNDNCESLTLPQVIFFENCQYQFEWFFKGSVKQAQLTHKLQAINNSFRFSDHRNTPVLAGTVNTGNDLGWFVLPFRYDVDGLHYSQAMSFEVFPVKMDLHNDLEGMYRAIDKNYPLWRFSLANKTQQNVESGNTRGNFPLLWLAHFEELRKKMMAGLKVITYGLLIVDYSQYRIK